MPNTIDYILKKAFPFFVMIAPAIFMLIFVFILSHMIVYRNRNRKNPLTQKLLRSPGEALFGKITDLQLKVIETIFIWCVLPPLLYEMSLHLIEALRSVTLLYSVLVVATMSCLYGAVKSYSMLKRLSDLRLAYDGELSVGQELNELMLDGFRVFHDMQAESFNIDHAVVGPSGVFAIETKTRSKNLDAKGTEAVEVLYDGESITFPHWKDTKMLEQAKSNALWLERKLTNAVGEKISVFPVVAIPGWFTKKVTSKHGPIVYNGKHPRAIFPKCGQGACLSEGQVKRIAHQLEQLCRNIEPIILNRKKKVGA